MGVSELPIGHSAQSTVWIDQPIGPFSGYAARWVAIPQGLAVAGPMAGAEPAATSPQPSGTGKKSQWILHPTRGAGTYLKRQWWLPGCKGRELREAKVSLSCERRRTDLKAKNPLPTAQGTGVPPPFGRCAAVQVVIGRKVDCGFRRVDRHGWVRRGAVTGSDLLHE